MRLGEECWVLTTGEAGMRSQALGLAAAAGLPIREERIALAPPWRWLPGGLLPVPLRAVDTAGDPLAPPWPRLLVCCGRRSIGPALAVKRASGGRTIAAYVQNPELAGDKFDLVVALPHDAVEGVNVVHVPTALHGVTPDRLAAAADEWRTRLNPTGAPLIGVLIGGDNGAYRLAEPALARLVAALCNANRSDGSHAVLTPSRRTGAAAKRFLAGALAGADWAMLWDGIGDNPYLGILGLSDRLIATADSISMISEALATGRPTHVLPLEGRGRRHDEFLARLVGEEIVSPILGDALDLAFAGHPPILPTVEPAQRLRELLAAPR
jgi:mitochondrial fission protein ELM1